MRYYYDYSFPIGNLTIEEDGHGICGIYFGTKILEGEKKNTELIREAALQLSQYFDGRRKKFDLKLSYHGTEFQIKVWKALEKIPQRSIYPLALAVLLRFQQTSLGLNTSDYGGSIYSLF